ncbi:MAG: aldehyde dehydrogenase family protein [candidate division KSB1 bacterium]|nr:aldehyde dehydrogenase family protein [candidate division KSB1 bacterium]MDZ7366054.1 aldehyde dehydrogenase family protein [candidate division KSB1 bacterium]MDZ7404171.1 aldehyde dehydrogenase family protein [candidate division KSB1 bacterium]
MIQPFSSGAQVQTKVQSLDPATGEVWQEYDSATPQQVHEAVATAHAAQKSWGALPIKDRFAPLRKFFDLLFERRMEVAALITRENGKPVAEALVAEVIVSLDLLKFYLRYAPVWLRTKRLPHENIALIMRRGYVAHEPLGVVGIISPWNYPLMLPLSGTLAALIAGNAVVMKPSEFTPTIALEMQKLFREAGLPDGVFQVVVGDGSTGAALAASEVNKIVFTGSTATGKKVAAAAAEKLIPVVMELGGSDPMLVLRDADLEHAASGAIWARFMNCGQSCVAVKRVFVEQEIYDAFVTKVVEKVKRLRLGPGSHPDTDVGPMIRERQVAALESQLNDAIVKGATVLCGGKRRPDLGPLFFEPTVVVKVNPTMKVLQEETFGPLLPIVPVRDVEKAIELANATPHGLAASIWTNDVKRGRELAQRIETGAVLINDAVSHVGACEVPHGGAKASGYGRTHGRDGLLEMTRTKYLDVDPITFVRKPWWFRYDANLLQQLNRFAEAQFSRSLFARLRGVAGSLGLLWRKTWV